jgi:hypothetical protein
MKESSLRGCLNWINSLFSPVAVRQPLRVGEGEPGEFRLFGGGVHGFVCGYGASGQDYGG